MKIIVLRTGDAIPVVASRRGQFFDWIRREVGPHWPGVWAEHDARGDEPLPGPRDADLFIITGSSSSVTERAPWMLRVEAAIREIAAAETPLFGICFGHQIVGQALGGHVARNPRGREIGTREVRVLASAGGDVLVRGLGDRFIANHTHVDSVVEPPKGARILAETDLEACAAFGVGEHVRCVQFHPEMDGDAMRGYVEARAPIIEREGLPAQTILDATRDAPGGAETLRNFVRAVASRAR